MSGRLPTPEWAKAIEVNQDPAWPPETEIIVGSARFRLVVDPAMPDDEIEIRGANLVRVRNLTHREETD